MTMYNIKIGGDKVTDVATKGEEAKSVQNAPDEEKQILIDGPLSAIYTQALNIAYAKESTADGQAGFNIDTRTVVDDASLTQPDLYVYVTSDDAIDREGINKSFSDISLAMDKYKDTKKIIVLESKNSKITNIASLEDYFSSIKVPVSYSRKIAIEKIMSSL